MLRETKTEYLKSSEGVVYNHVVHDSGRRYLSITGDGHGRSRLTTLASLKILNEEGLILSWSSRQGKGLINYYSVNTPQERLDKIHNLLTYPFASEEDTEGLQEELNRIKDVFRI